MIDKKKTGDNIRRLSSEKGVSLHKLSLIFGGGSLVYKWATGEMMPSINNLFRLSHVFECSVYDIVEVKKTEMRNIDYCMRGIDEILEIYDVSKVAESKECVKKWLMEKYEE